MKLTKLYVRRHGGAMCCQDEFPSVGFVGPLHNATVTIGIGDQPDRYNLTGTVEEMEKLAHKILGAVDRFRKRAAIMTEKP